MKLYCINCNLYIGEIREGRLRKEGFFVLCPRCKKKWKVANDMAETVSKDLPYFMKDLFK
jgi:hypothetical protein